jgi:ubiquinone/menaquinone biosynthesis C-methylase UbiE
MSPWDDARTVRLYDAFTKRFPMYGETSRDLVRLADVASATTIVDLACGTGATTRAVLAVAPPAATVVAIDSSPAMLSTAQENIRDERVSFVLADAATIGEHLDTADAIVCNSAIWQFEMTEVFAATARVLQPGGRFAFNIGRQFIMLPFTSEDASRTKPGLGMYAEAIAVLEYDYAAPLGRRRGRPLSRDIVESMLADAGLELAAFEVLTYAMTAEAARAWFEIPIFADNVLYGMPYERQLEVIAKAYERVDAAAVEQNRWACFVARPS